MNHPKMNHQRTEGRKGLFAGMDVAEFVKTHKS